MLRLHSVHDVVFANAAIDLHSNRLASLSIRNLLVLYFNRVNRLLDISRAALDHNLVPFVQVARKFDNCDTGF